MNILLLFIQVAIVVLLFPIAFFTFFGSAAFALIRDNAWWFLGGVLMAAAALATAVTLIVKLATVGP